MKPIFPPDSFIQEIHFALQNLYDPVALLKSKLVIRFNLENRPNPGLALQDTITSSIDALRPRLDVPLQSNAWRLFNVLKYRYVEQSSQNLVADMLGLSVRQLRRHEKAAEQLLSEFLWKTCVDADRYPFFSHDDTSLASGIQEPLKANITLQTNQEHELDWLKETTPDQLTGINQIVSTAIDSIQPLIQNSGVRVYYEKAIDDVGIIGPISVIRQTLINLLLGVLDLQRNGEIYVFTEVSPQSMVDIIITTDIAAKEEEISGINDYFIMAQNLARIYDGEVSYTIIPVFQMKLSIRLTEKQPVLIVDDNIDTLQLYQRYLSDTHYQFFGVRDPERALETALEIKPKVVVMDVMLPGMDEWELLGRFKNHPEFQNIPVVICTILPQEELARVLGAAAFIRKPVNRTEFLSVLDRQINHGLKTHH
jgi:CheY-like chemotaxis protein